MNNIKKEKTFGFTLIEILVVISILGVLFVIGANVFSYILKGSDKANVMAEINENGAYVLDNIIRSVRSSSLIKSCTNARLDLWNQDQTGYSVIRTSTANFSKLDGKSGCSLLDSNCYSVNYVEMLNSCDPKVGDASCTSSTLSNTHPLNGVNVKSLSFDCPLSSNPSVITLNLTLKQGAARQSNEAETEVPFKTSVEIRTF